MVRQEGGGREGGKGIPEGSDLSRRIMRKCIFTFFQKMVKVFPLLFSFSCDDTKEKKKPFFVPSSRSPAYSCLLLLLPGLAIILCMCYTRTPFFPFSPFMTGHALNWREKESGRNFQDARKIWKCNFGFSTEKVKVSQLSQKLCICVYIKHNHVEIFMCVCIYYSIQGPSLAFTCIMQRERNMT